MQLASTLFEGFGNVLIFALFGIAFVFLNLFVIGKIILRRPNKPDFGEKAETYECGEPARARAPIAATAAGFRAARWP